MRVATAQMNYRARDGELVLDTTFKTGHGLGEFFAPTKDIVYDIKYHHGTWTDYCEKYNRILNKRLKEYYKPFHDAVNSTQIVVFKCYCADDGKHECHRYLLVKFFENLCARMNAPFTYLGEFK